MSTDAIAVAMPLEREPPQNVGLSSPPDSNKAPKEDASDSELSDIEDPEEDIGEVVPERYDGGVPVFVPTMNQFASFERYMKKINSYGMQTGIVKVIPPAEWRAALPSLDQAIKTIRVKEPIKQDIMGTNGTYRQANIVHQRSYNLPQWRQLCEQSEHQPPAKRGERRPNQEKTPRPAPKARAPATPSGQGPRKRGVGRPTKGNKPKVVNTGTSEVEETPDRLPTPVSPSMKPEDDVEFVKQEADDEDECPTKVKGGRQPKATTVSSRRKYNRREAAGKIDEEAFKDFKYQLEGEDFSPERCEELERTYWKTLTYAPPLYGADMPGTLFDDRTTIWNLGKLENLLDIMGAKIPGVNTAYLYLGMWKATFAWHLEDVDLYSINYVHFGAPKQWYSISQKDARRFETAMKSIFPTDAKACDQFLRHKTFLISPSHLLQNFSIKVNKIVAHPGEFVITFPYGYHSGYNLGYNCAEAVNFALDSWLEFGRVAKKCDCSQAQDSVWIDVHELDRKLRGEETDYEETEDEEEEDDDETNENGPTDLPTPPESSGDGKIKAPRRKRKRSTHEKDAKTSVKRIRVRIKAPSKEPCLLCPNDIPSEPLLPTDDGRKAHRLCALYIPETSIDKDETEIVTDIKYIDKARLELKCNYCRSKKGACFQCSQKKCTRSYHATCAAAAGVYVEQGEIPVFGEDGTEYKDYAIEFSCRFHRIKRDKKLDGEALENDERIRKAALELSTGQVCQMQYYRGDIFAGVVVENRSSEEMILVDILPRGERVEVEYKWILIPDPADYRLPKPSPTAIPMPKSRKDKESLNTTKRSADDLPRAEDSFAEGFTWAEFKLEKIDRNAAQVKIDLEKENQIWYYLGKNSTEAKAQFTEDLAKPRHNPRGHFLDTIPKPATPTPRQSFAASYPSTVNQRALNATKTTSRPSLPANSNKPEKPYVYKPRTSSDSYRIDPQAYHTQQAFLQQSAPYSFGTDPRWRQPDIHSTNPYSGHPASPSSAPPAPKSDMAPPTALPRPASAITILKPSNPFSGRPQSSTSNARYSARPNPFAKYAYLQAQHNRSPLEYKSPYRPGGGFMNGYQGSLEKHLQQTLFQKSSGSGPLLPNPLLAYGSGHRTSSAPSQPLEKPLHNPEPSSNYDSYGMPNTLTQLSQQSHQATQSATKNVWEKKDNSQLHPAIRQEYNSMFHHQYQPSQRPQTLQFRDSRLPLQQDAEPQTIQQNQQAQDTKYDTQSKTSPQPCMPLYQYQTQHQMPIPSHPDQPQNQPPPQRLYQESRPAYEDVEPVEQENTAMFQEPNRSYPHQQYFQKPQDSQTPISRPRDFPDVPVDSATLIEKMMMNLKKATAGSSTG